MITKRRNIFETNSSSCHSLSVSNTDPQTTKQYIEKYKKIYSGTQVHMNFGEYGFGPDELHGFIEKLRYMLTMIATHHGGNYGTAQIETLKNVKEHKVFNLLIQIIKNELNADFITTLPWSDSINFGYVDHDSTGILDHLLYESEEQYEKIVEYLFNDEIIVNIDGNG